MSPELKIYPDISSISHPFKGILLDAYGVFWGGNAFGLLPGSKEMMEKLVSDGKIVGILSNSTQLASKETSKLKKYGLLQGKHFHFFCTSGETARSIFMSDSQPFSVRKKYYYLFGGMHPKFTSHEAIFKDSGYVETSALSEADFIFISVPHLHGEDQTDPKFFRDEVEKFKHIHLPIVCPNPDMFAHEGNPPHAVVRQGSIASMFEEMGSKVFYIGKPHKTAYQIAMDQFYPHHLINPKDILMVGDTPETDIRGARKFGMASALIMQTGIMGDRVHRYGTVKAIDMIDPNDLPNYFIGRFSHVI